MFKKTIISFIAFAVLFSTSIANAALSCTVTTTCNSPAVVVLRMASVSNSHSELPSQSNYPQLVCCSGETGLGNSCSGTHSVLLRLSGNTNAHVEENSQSTATYNGHDACLSIATGTVSVGYQNANCSGFDTTVVSMATPTTNSHVGDGGSYTRKVCASASSSGTPPPPDLCSTIGCGSTGGPIAPPSPIIKNKILKTADFNNDGKVDILDLSILLYRIDQGGNGYSMYDLNQDGVLDFLDVSILFFYWDQVF